MWCQLLVFALVAPVVQAQVRPALTVQLPPADSLGATGPLVRATGVLRDGSVRELLDNGFPARLTYLVELWTTAGWFDRQLRSTTWDVVVRFDPIRRLYDAVKVVDDTPTPLGSFATLADAIAAVEQPHRANIRAPVDRSRTYYNVVLTLEMLSVSDLDELQRWVKGDLSPAVRGRRNPGTALSRGARTLLSRLLGGERRTLETRTETFTAR